MPRFGGSDDDGDFGAASFAASAAADAAACAGADAEAYAWLRRHPRAASGARGGLLGEGAYAQVFACAWKCACVCGGCARVRLGVKAR